MQQFANLLDCLTTTPSRNGKLALLVEYFRDAPDPDRGFALAALTDGLFPRLPLRRALSELMADKIDPVLYQLSRDYVGDTAETVSLLWPDRRDKRPSPRLAEVVAALALAPRSNVAPILGDFLDRLDVRGRWALLKLVGGAPRVGVSARLAKTALAQMSGHELSDIEEIWHALKPPYADLFAWLEGRGPRPERRGQAGVPPADARAPDRGGRLGRRSIPKRSRPNGSGTACACRSPPERGDVRIFSRSGDDISAGFPEIVAAFAAVRRRARRRAARRARWHRRAVQRLAAAPQPQDRHRQDAARLSGLRAPLRSADRGRRGRASAPLHRAARAARGLARHASSAARATSAQLVPFDHFQHLDELWSGTREAGIEGLMLKRKSSPYVSGRPKGHWWKWKRAALTVDCVLMYAQRGSGKRSSLLFRLHVRRLARGADEDGKPLRELVPVGKAYSGFTDEELRSP